MKLTKKEKLKRKKERHLTTKKYLKKLEKRERNKKDKLNKILLTKEMFERDKGRCVFCNKEVSKKHYQTCHIIPFEFEDTRYDLNNVLLACFYHHKVGKYSMHNHPLWLVEWLKKNRQTQYLYLIEKIKYISDKEKNN